MSSRLRAATRQAHEALESSLNLLDPPLRQERFRRVLVRFESFHRAWEPKVERLIGDDGFTSSRRRLPHLQADLAALGAEVDQAAAPDLSYLSDAAAAWGSIYVMEGSTLGGQVISKALSGAPWLPAGGLRYFSPHGRRTAEVWRETMTAVERGVERWGEERVISGAVSSFEALAAWVTLPPELAR